MKSDLRHQLAEKMAGEITLSESPGKALKKWRTSFNIPQGVLCEHLEVSPSVISDYESGRRKSPGTAVVGKIVETILAIDEANGGKYIRKFGKILYSDIDESVIYDIVDYPSPVLLSRFADLLGAKTLCGSLSQSIFGYTVVNSLNAITQLSSNEFNRIYG
jgi:putative transcriptional regulator